ncbi:MAG: cell envelope-related transcriptional attenuator [Actinomycetia bacterium]|nr:cell envelope-related transcriptional attenuator [Actinomycetes bacterium]
MSRKARDDHDGQAEGREGSEEASGADKANIADKEHLNITNDAKSLVVSASKGSDEDPGDADEAQGTKDPQGVENPPASPSKRRRGRRILAWVGGVTAVILLATVGTGTWLYFNLQGNIHHEHADSGELGTNRPVKLNKSTNILLVGSDSRAGANSQYGVDTGARSDTTILLHVSPNGDRAVAISFPRDSMVQIPACKKKNGSKTPAQFGMINVAFAEAGAVCTWHTLESLTGIHIDHFVEVDFSGFKRVVDALGGVEICVPRPIIDPRADLTLKAGRQIVKGDQALGYVRTRYVLGDGSDLDRIKRQQKFLASVAKKALDGNMLADPMRTYRFLSAATKSITTDDKLTVNAMRKLAGSVKGMTTGKVRFVTVPTHAYPKDPNRVEWDMTQARPLFDAIRGDNNLPEVATSPTPVPSQAAVAPLPAPGKVKITVLAADKAAGRQSADRLAVAGFKIAKVKVEKARTAETWVSYGPGAERQAAAVAALLAGVNPIARKGEKGMVYLVVGDNGVQLINLPPAAIPPVAGGVTASQNLCGADA